MLAGELKLSASEFLRLNFHGLTTLCGDVLTIGLDTDAVPANTKYNIKHLFPRVTKGNNSYLKSLLYYKVLQSE